MQVYQEQSRSPKLHLLPSTETPMAPPQNSAGLRRNCSPLTNEGCHGQPWRLVTSPLGMQGCSFPIGAPEVAAQLSIHGSILQAEGHQAADSDAQWGMLTLTSVVSLPQMPWAFIWYLYYQVFTWVGVTALSAQAYETQLLTFLPSLALVVSVLGDGEATRRLWVMSDI